MLPQFLKRVASSYEKITVQFLYSLSLVKFLLLYNQMFEFFIRNDLISQNQSGFKPDESCINQLLTIIHEIWKSFDACLDVRTVFLNISKAFDKVWHQGLLCKLKQNRISGNLLETSTDFLKG